MESCQWRRDHLQFIWGWCALKRWWRGVTRQCEALPSSLLKLEITEPELDREETLESAKLGGADAIICLTSTLESSKNGKCLQIRGPCSLRDSTSPPSLVSVRPLRDLSAFTFLPLTETRFAGGHLAMVQWLLPEARLSTYHMVTIYQLLWLVMGKMRVVCFCLRS